MIGTERESRACLAAWESMPFLHLPASDFLPAVRAVLALVDAVAAGEVNHAN